MNDVFWQGHAHLDLSKNFIYMVIIIFHCKQLKRFLLYWNRVAVLDISKKCVCGIVKTKLWTKLKIYNKVKVKVIGNSKSEVDYNYLLQILCEYAKTYFTMYCRTYLTLAAEKCFWPSKLIFDNQGNALSIYGFKNQ